MQLARGSRLRSYEVLGPLGAGGMGSVYRAHDSRLGRDIAIKVLRDGLGGAEDLQRFEREARAASALNHPNIVTVFDIGEYEGSPYIAMELVEGSSLRAILQRGRPPLRTLLDLATQIADGLAAAHDRGIVHRDLKPENVMVTTEGRVKIVDFGLARFTGVIDADASTASFFHGSDHIVGTAAYMSPEQASGRPKLDYRSDQFAFGSVLYELATGRRAFDGETRMEILTSIMRDDPLPLADLAPSVPAPLRWLIERCMAKEPSQRYESTRDLARELRTLRERLPETSPGTPRTKPSVARSTIFVTAAVVLIAGAVLVNLWKSAPDPAVQSRPIPSIAVAAFADDPGQAEDKHVGAGLAEALRDTFTDYGGIRLIDRRLPGSGASSPPLEAATLQLTGTVRSSNERLAATYQVRDTSSATIRSQGTVTASDLLTLKNEIAAAIARDLRLVPIRSPRDDGLRTPEEWKLYASAIGAMNRATDAPSVDRVIRVLQELLETSDSSLVYAALGRAYYLKFGYTSDGTWSEKARQLSLRAQERNAGSADTLVTLGFAESIRGHYEEALKAFNQALTILPTSAPAAIGAGLTLGASARYPAAEQMFRRGIALDPNWYFGYSQLGTLFWLRGKYKEAYEQYETVMRLEPDLSTGYTSAGTVLLAWGRPKEALEMLNRATERNPNDSMALAALSECHFYLGNFEKAVAAAEAAVKVRADRSRNWIYRADACRWSKSCPQQAEGFYRDALARADAELAVNPFMARPNESRAIALAELGDYKRAREAIAKAIRVQPENPDLQIVAARIEHLSGNDGGMSALLARAVALGGSQLLIDHHPELRTTRSPLLASGF